MIYVSHEQRLFPLMQTKYTINLRYPAITFLSLTAPCSLPGRQKWEFAQLAVLGPERVRRPQLSVCLLLVLLEAMEVLQTSPVRFPWVVSYAI